MGGAIAAAAICPNPTTRLHLRRAIENGYPFALLIDHYEVCFLSFSFFFSNIFDFDFFDFFFLKKLLGTPEAANELMKWFDPPHDNRFVEFFF